jgi:hypothetical protein
VLTTMRERIHDLERQISQLSASRK